MRLMAVTICFTLLEFTGGYVHPRPCKSPSLVKLTASIDRRSWLITTGSVMISPLVSEAEDGTVTTEEATPLLPAVDMKDFVDPVGYFEISVPKRFFAIRRSSKGDLPDDAKGQGRRGSSIFTAGDLTKLEVVAVER